MKSLVLTIPILLGVVSLTAISAMAQSNFTQYEAGTLFTIGYPPGWTLNETAVGNPDSSSGDLTHQVKFTAPSDNATVSITWKPMSLEHRPGELNKNIWLNRLSSDGTVLSLDNQTQYVLNQPALTAIIINGMIKTMVIITYQQVPLGTYVGAHGIWIIEFVYSSSIDNYPTYLDQFQTLVSKFHVNA